MVGHRPAMVGRGMAENGSGKALKSVDAQRKRMAWNRNAMAEHRQQGNAALRRRKAEQGNGLSMEAHRGDQRWLGKALNRSDEQW